MLHTSVVITHGGTWSGKDYSGGEEELIPIPGGPLKFTDLLRKIELRIRKPKSRYAYDIHAVVKSETGRIIKMKIIDDYDVDYVLRDNVEPIFYVTTTPIIDELLEFVNDEAARGTLAKSPNPQTNVSRNLEKGVSCTRNLSRNLDEDLNRTQNLNFDDRDFDRELDRGMNRDFDDRGLGRDFGREDASHNPFVETRHRLEVDDDVDSIENVDCGSMRQNLTSVGSRNDLFEGDQQYSGQWTIPGASYVLKEPTTTYDDLGNEGIGDDTLCKDAIFSSKAKMTTVLGLYHLANHVSFDTPRSCTKRYHAVCKNRKKTVCSFICCAQALGNAWQITQWEPHTCAKDYRFHAEPSICSKVLGAYFTPNLMTAGVVLRSSDIIAEIRRHFGATIQYQTALNARNHALTMVYGDASKSFQRLPKYLWILEQANPGSFADLKVDDDGKFKYCFMALAACVTGFKACRPVIVVDGTHLKGKFKGVMFVAVTKDANEQIFPLAFGFGDKECDESWTWFFRQLRRAFGCRENLLIVSDQHFSIKNALDVVYPGVPHGLCVYHLQGNIRFSGEKAIAIFKQAVLAYRDHDFDEAMANLNQRAPGAYEKVMGVDPAKWARSKCPVRRYRFLTSNAAECLNGCLRWARTLPVCTLFECVRSLIGQWFVERRAAAVDRTHELTEYGQARMGRASELGSTMSVEAISTTKFKVSTGMKHHVVDLERKQCTYLIFDRDMIPCSHAAAALRHTRQSPIPYVSTYYSTQKLQETYVGEVMPIPIPEEWIVPPEVEAWDVGTPDNPRQAGRPRKRRIKAVAESSRSQSHGNSYTTQCSRCSKTGHYKNTCRAQLAYSNGEATSSVPTTSKRRRPKTCSICSAVGHTRQTCPARSPPQ